MNFNGIKGLVAIRGWGCNKLLLNSTAMSHEWNDFIEVADVIPSPDNDNGIYSYTLKQRGQVLDKDVVGIIELRGKILEYTDGVLRSEWARILRLFVKEDEANSLRLLSFKNLYRVPITVTNDMEKSISKWAKENLKHCEEYNDSVLAQYSNELPEPKAIEGIEWEKWKIKKGDSSYGYISLGALAGALITTNGLDGDDNNAGEKGKDAANLWQKMKRAISKDK